MDEQLYKMIFKRKSFHLFKDTGTEKISITELKDIRKKFNECKPLIKSLFLVEVIIGLLVVSIVFELIAFFKLNSKILFCFNSLHIYNTKNILFILNFNSCYIFNIYYFFAFI